MESDPIGSFGFSLMCKYFSLLIFIFMPTFTSAEQMLEEKLTPEELAAFDEAPNLFKIKKLPPIANVQVKREPLFINGRKIFWKSNNEIFLSVDHLEEWQAKKGEAPKLIVLNTDTGKIETTPYRGYLMCFKPERMLVCPLPTDGLPCSKMDSPRAQQQGSPFMVGAWGQSLTAMTKEMHEGLDHETCEQYAPDPNIGKKVGEVKIISHLGPNHGYVGLGDWSPGSQKFALLDQAGEIYWQTDFRNSCEGVHRRLLNKWDDSYFIGGNFSSIQLNDANSCTKNHYFLLTHPRENNVKEMNIPNLFNDWLKYGVASLGIHWTKRGLLLFTFTKNSSRQGLFWVDELGRIKRLLAGRYIRTVKVSPNGCKVLLQHFAGTKSYLTASEAERREIERSFETSVMDMCQGEHKSMGSDSIETIN